MLRWILAVALLLPPLARTQDPYAGKRAQMVRMQVEDRGVRNPDVLRAMREIPRHLFMPERVRGLAYGDYPVQVGYGQTISQPYIVGFMTELLGAERTHTVLEIGTGSGYQAAVLSRLVHRVCSIEIVPELARSAASTLKKLGYDNVTVRLGDGYKGWPELAPFDRVILTAAPPRVPQELIDQLKRGGRLVAPEGSPAFGQQLVVIEKSSEGKITRKAVLPVMFVPMVRGRE